jgi:sugar phosphate isomerase/epimerase
MNISIAVSTYRSYNNGKDTRSMPESISFLRSVGFEYLDVGLTSYKNHDDFLWADNWREQTLQIAQQAKDLGITFYQGHSPFMKGSILDNLKTPEGLEEYKEYFRRSVIAAGMLGVKWLVVHPLNCPEKNFERKACLEANHAFWDPFVELAAQNKVAIAFENQLPYLTRSYPFRYCSHYEDLCELIDSYNDPRLVGACWDTGHANQAQFDQYRALKTVGSRLQVLHLNDNHYGNKDEHLLPWMGQVNWDDVIRALVEINYPGTLNYETGKTSKYAYGEAQKQLIRLSYNNACYFAKRYEEELHRQGK